MVESTGERGLPVSLRETVERERGPVRPLLPPIVRAIIAFLVSLFIAGLFVSMTKIRGGEIQPLSLWLPVWARVAAGFFLLWLALAEGVPGSGSTLRMRVMSLLLVPFLLVGLAEFVVRTSGPGLIASTTMCYSHELRSALPALLLVAFLLARAYPLRPVFSATAGASAIGLVADAMMHLSCPISSRSHTLMIHGGAVITIAAAAALIAWLTRRRWVGMA